MTVETTTPNHAPFYLGSERLFLVATAFWAFAAAMVGVLLALLLVMPKLFYELGESGQYFSFGRLYPLHLQMLVYGMLGNGFFAFAYFGVQRFCRVTLLMPSLAIGHLLIWQAIVCGAIVTSVSSGAQGRLLAYAPWWFDVASVAVWLGLFVPVMLTTVSRKDKTLRIAPPLWFVLASMIAIPMIQLLGNVSSSSGSLYGGVQDAMVQWWSARGLVTFWMTVPAVGLLYSLVAKVGSGVIHSYRLTVIHFWSIVLLGCWGGNVQWHFSAITEVADSVAMFAGLLLWLGCLGGAYNLWKSLRQTSGEIRRNVVQRLTTAAIVCYVIYCLDGIYMSMKSFALTTQFTDWATANQYLAIFGVSGLALVAFSFSLVPGWAVATNSGKRGTWLRRFAVEGAALQIIALYVAGRTQSFSWFHLNDLGRLEYPEFVNAIRWAQPLWVVVVVGAVLWLMAMMLWVISTLRSSTDITIDTPTNINTALMSDPVAKPSPLVGAPVLEVAIGLQNWSQLLWHVPLERRSSALMLRLTAAFLVGLLIFYVPVLLAGASSIETPLTQSPYTALESIGREIYIREGCVSCHTQASRPLVPEVLRFGAYSQKTDYQFDRPTQFGFRRVGPDLAREGGRQTSFWHWQHLENPQNITADSVMPAFDHILASPLDSDDEAVIKQAELIAAEMVSGGGPILYDGRLVMNSRGVALIAYLQRLGVVAPIAVTTAATIEGEKQ